MSLLKQRGAVFSSFVILIATITLGLLVHSMNRDVMVYRVDNATLLEEQFKTLGESLTLYYVSTCTTGVVNQADLVPNYLNQSIAMHESDPYGLSIDDSGPIPTYTIAIDINSTLDIDLFAYKLRQKGAVIAGPNVSMTVPIFKFKQRSQVQVNPCNL